MRTALLIATLAGFSAMAAADGYQCRLYRPLCVSAHGPSTCIDKKFHIDGTPGERKFETIDGTRDGGCEVKDGALTCRFREKEKTISEAMIALGDHFLGLTRFFMFPSSGGTFVLTCTKDTIASVEPDKIYDCSSKDHAKVKFDSSKPSNVSFPLSGGGTVGCSASISAIECAFPEKKDVQSIFYYGTSRFALHDDSGAGIECELAAVAPPKPIVELSKVGKWSQQPADAPSVVNGGRAFWVGEELIVSGVAVSMAIAPKTGKWRVLPRRPGMAYVGAQLFASENGITYWVGDGTWYRYESTANTWKAMPALGHFQWGPALLGLPGKYLVWGGENGKVTDEGFILDVATGRKKSMSRVNAPSARAWAASVWTGKEWIIWGGKDDAGKVLASGGIYDPASDSWKPMNNVGAPALEHGYLYEHIPFFWTGTDLLVWSGDGWGAIYSPAANLWRRMSAKGAPARRYAASYAWTGSGLIEFGGYGRQGEAGGSLANGGLYDFQSDSWRLLDPKDAPSARWLAYSAWTGDAFLIWGGFSEKTGWMQKSSLYTLRIR